MKGFYVKCKECNKKFWLSVTLSFGAKKDENSEEILNSFLHSVIFNFNCPHCGEPTEAGIGFRVEGEPQVLDIKKPTYIG